MEVIRGNTLSINDSKTKGWIVGHMHQGVQGTNAFEIKMWHYDEPFEYGQKMFQGTEFISIYGGVLRFKLEFPSGENEEIIIVGRRHDFIIIPPGTKKQVIVEVVPAFGDTVRWPSMPGANQVLEQGKEAQEVV